MGDSSESLDGSALNPTVITNVDKNRDMKLDVDVLRYLSKDDFKHEIVPFRTRASHCFSQALEEHGFPVPSAVDCNRHCVIMYLVHGYPLKRFHLNFQETTYGDDGSDIDTEESSRLSFASISKTSGFLVKELAASGFTGKDQDVIEKFIEGGIKKESGSNDEGSDNRNESETNGTNVNGLDSLHLAEQGVIHKDPALNSKKEGVSEENQQNSEAGRGSEPDRHNASDKEDDDESVNENDAELVKQIEKQRRRAVAAVGDESLLPQEIPARLRVANPPTIPKSKSN